MLHHEDAGWANPKVLSILAIVFICGSVVGAAGMREYMHHRLKMPAAHDFIYHGRRVSFDTLKTDLTLSSAQEQSVEQVLDDFAKYYQNLEEQRDDVTEAAKRKIYAVLDPEQKKRLAGLLREDEPKTTP